MRKYKFLLVIFFIINGFVYGQCPPNTIYGVRQEGPPYDGVLVTYNPANGAINEVRYLFDAGSPASTTAPVKAVTAIGIDPATGIIYYPVRAQEPTQGRLYAYNTITNTFLTTDIPLPVITGQPNGLKNWNKCGFNTKDGNVYIQDGRNGTLVKVNPSTGTTTVMGILSFPGSVVGNMSFGDLIFDDLGNMFMVGSNNNDFNGLIFFPATYSGGVYTGPAIEGTIISSPDVGGAAGLAAMSDGNFIVSYGVAGRYYINIFDPVTGTLISNMLTPDYQLTDLTSCTSFTPHLQYFTKIGIPICNSMPHEIKFYIKVKNDGNAPYANSKIADALPSGLTLASVELNGTVVPGVTSSNLASGIDVNSPGASTGVIAAGEEATLIVTLTGAGDDLQYSNQASFTYAGSPNSVLSDNPNTSAPNDPTVVSISCLAINGNIFNDANGMVDNFVNGTPILGDDIQEVMYVNLLDANGNVVDVTKVVDGIYSFQNVQANTNYTVQLTINKGVIGSTAPPTKLPEGWVNTGEHVGASAGGDGDGNGKLSVPVGTSSVDQVNFGIERTPTSDDVSQAIPQPTGSAIPEGTITTDVSGSDPEDGTYTSGDQHTIVITVLPNNASMYYDGKPAFVGMDIGNFDPALLSFTSIAGGSTSVQFDYTFLDAADKPGVEGTYVISWPTPLPIIFGNIQAYFSGNDLVVNWETLIEIDNSHFLIEVSKDGANFKTLGEVSSKAENGNSNSKLQYSFKEDITTNNIWLGFSIFAFVLSLIFFSKRNKYLFTTVLALGIFIFGSYSCNKNASDMISNKNTAAKLFVRIVQVNKDGTKQFSKIITVVNK